MRWESERELLVSQLYKWSFFVSLSEDVWCMIEWHESGEVLGILVPTTESMHCNQLYIKMNGIKVLSVRKNVLIRVAIYYKHIFLDTFCIEENPNHNIGPLPYRLFPWVIVLICIIPVTFRNCINNYHIPPRWRNMWSRKIHTTLFESVTVKANRSIRADVLECTLIISRILILCRVHRWNGTVNICALKV